MYLTTSRPDIMFAVYACARFQVTPKVSHLHVVKRIFRYLKGQPKLGLWYPKDSPFDLEAYTDSDYAGASLYRKSTTGADEIVIKEWEDRIERAATTASSLEAEQDSEKLEESDGFEGIIDFLNASSIKYALTVNPTIYNSCIKQFWATAKVQTINEEVQIQALVDGKKVIVTETSVRRALHLKDAKGTYCLPTATIFAELERMRYENLTQKLTFYKAFFSPQWKFLIHTILQWLSAKTTAWNEFSSTMASAIILFLDKQVEGMSKHKEIYVTPSHTKKIFAYMKREGKRFSGRVTPLFQTMMVQAPEEVGEGSAAPTNSHHTM
ncbi:hypothetical protein Tco_1367047 [Tanacetum coccineum]